jgi:branched-chain amino acid transport system permease protein
MSLEGQLVLALLEGIVSGSILALTALGLSLVFGVMRIVNIAHGEFYMLGAVVAWSVAHATGSFALALAAGPLVAVGVALAADRFVLRPIGYRPEATIVATIGLLYILQQGVLMAYGPEARSVAAPVDFIVVLPWFGYSGYKLVLGAAAAVLLILTGLMVRQTRLGLYMRATQQDPETARAFGVPVERIYAMAFALGAALAAAAGALIAPVRQAYYLMGPDALLLSFIVVILGGLGNLAGTIAAALLVGLIDGVVSVFFAPTLAKIVATLLVALVLIARRGGLYGEETP